MDLSTSIAHRAQVRTTLGRLSLYKAAALADRAWMAEVVEVFGERGAGMARVQDRAQGAHGTKLRELHDAYLVARDAYRGVLVRH